MVRSAWYQTGKSYWLSARSLAKSLLGAPLGFGAVLLIQFLLREGYLTPALTWTFAAALALLLFYKGHEFVGLLFWWVVFSVPRGEMPLRERITSRERWSFRGCAACGALTGAVYAGVLA